MGAAQTGTGKTAAFSLPLLHKMLPHENSSMSPARHPVRALVIAPTRELADQVADNIKGYAAHSKLRVAVVFGGIDMKPQTLELKPGVEVLVATPGRLLDHIEAKNCVLNQVEYVVLDEADRMLDIGFLPDLQRILCYLPKQRQTLLFSATFSPEIRRLAESYLQDPLLVEVARPNATATNVEQHFYSVATDDKRRAVLKLLKERSITQALVFVNSKLGCARLARSFERDGLRTNALHGDKSQDERLKALEAFKNGDGRRPGRDRRRRARPRHRRPAGGVQFRRAVQRRGLRPPHRPHRARRRVGAGDHAGLARRHAAGRRHREADQARRSRSSRSSSTTSRRAAAPRARRATTTSRATIAHPRRARLARIARRRVARRRASPRAERSVLRPALRADGERGRAGVGAARRRRRRAASRRTSSRRRRSPRCSAARYPSRPIPERRRGQRASEARTPPERRAGSCDRPAAPRAPRDRCASNRPASVRPQLTDEARVAGCRCASKAASRAALR